MVSLAVALFDVFLLPLLLLSKYINEIKTTLNTSKLLKCMYMYKFKAILTYLFVFAKHIVVCLDAFVNLIVYSTQR